jgi:RNA-dependent RNA polymerase
LWASLSIISRYRAEFAYPDILFELNTPTVLEAVQFHRSLTGDRERDSKKFKHRVDSLNDGHRLVAPYAHHLRLELFNEDGVLDRFVKLCFEAEISTSYIVRFPPLNPLTAERKGFFTGKRLHALNKVLRQLKWPVAFQIELLLHNGLLNTEQLDQLVEEIRNISKKQRAGYVSELLRAFSKELKEPQENRKPQESPLARFQAVRREFNYSAPPQSFRCYHVTFTPTRMVLEGPYPTQSNRVIRKYKGYEDHFIRVDFRDEDRLRYRWDREIDGTSFVQFRVGGILKNGFELAGRQFEFLAYSSSALREHAVWFVHPFQHPQGGLVNGTSIRASLGNFTELLKMPSKYAARLAQAFTATDLSVDIHREAWELVEDLVCSNKSYVFTDGVGTISRDLARRIWEKLCVHRINPPPEPSAVGELPLFT